MLLWCVWFPEPLQWKQQQDHTQLQQLGTVFAPANITKLSQFFKQVTQEIIFFLMFFLFFNVNRNHKAMPADYNIKKKECAKKKYWWQNGKRVATHGIFWWQMEANKSGWNFLY